MSIYTQQYPTWGALAREQVRRRGLLYFEDVQRDLTARLAAVAPDARRLFALACAERLMRRHEALPPEEQRPFTLGWRPVLDTMWGGLGGQYPQASEQVRVALDAYHAGAYDHDEGQDADEDGPPDADEDAAAASIFAAECFLTGDARAAGAAAGRTTDWVLRVVGEELQLDPNEFVWSPEAEPMPLAREAMHPAVQEELVRQLADIEELERRGVTPELLRQMAARPAA